jgi:methylated-DNA-protein-cysteine methyltransferase-like protein
VVNKEGRVSDAFVFGGKNRQIDLLRADGIEVSDDGYVNMKKYVWKGW